MKRTYLFYASFVILCLSFSLPVSGSVREKYNFNPQWLLHVGDMHGAEKVKFPDKDWEKITLPRAFNEDEAFKVPIKEMTDTVAWYRKHFKLPRSAKGKKVFIEFEGVRQGADFYLNGKHRTAREWCHGRRLRPHPLPQLQRGKRDRRAGRQRLAIPRESNRQPVPMERPELQCQLRWDNQKRVAAHHR